MNGIVRILLTSRWDRTTVMNLHSYVVFEIVVCDGNSSANIIAIHVILVDHIPDIDSVSTEISHVLNKCVLFYQNMWLFSLIPIRWIYSNGTSKGSNVILKHIIFDYNEFFIARDIDEAQSFILLEKRFSIGRRFALHHLKGLSKKEPAVSVDQVTDLELKLSCGWKIAKGLDSFQLGHRITTVQDRWNIMCISIEIWANYFDSPSKIF